jgi:hypothetical protein
MGEPTPEQHELSDAFVATCNLLLENLKPGTTYGQVAAKMDAYLDDIGYRQYALPGYGHGIGILGNEWYPVVLNSSTPYESQGDLVLQPNMIEVAAIVLNKPGVGGMRMETPVLITKAGNEPLNKVPVEPAIIDRPRGRAPHSPHRKDQGDRIVGGASCHWLRACAICWCCLRWWAAPSAPSLTPICGAAYRPDGGHCAWMA